MSRATPEEQETIRALIAQGMQGSQVAAAVGRSFRSVMYIAARHKLGPWKSHTGYAARDRSIIPDDFATLWETMSQAKLSRHYRVSNAAVVQWVRALGLIRLPTLAAERQPRKPSAPSKPRLVSTRVHGHKPAPFSDIYRDQSVAGQAADTLRRDNWKVNRCNAQGHYDPKGGMWRCGQVLCTDAELIERAARVQRRMAA